MIVDRCIDLDGRTVRRKTGVVFEKGKKPIAEKPPLKKGVFRAVSAGDVASRGGASRAAV
jgi:hypothetical protein